MVFTEEIILNLFCAGCEGDQGNTFLRAVFSEPLPKEDVPKRILRPAIVRHSPCIQVESFKNTQSFHDNLPLAEAEQLRGCLSEFLSAYRQLLLIFPGKSFHIRKTRGGFAGKIVENMEKPTEISHDRRKSYVLSEGEPVPFLVSLGIMNGEGRVYKEKRDKFRQINKYLEFMDGTIRELHKKNQIGNFIRCVDFGCGKSYLTFALEHYLKETARLDFEILGLDLKEDVIGDCNALAEKLAIGNLRFLNGDIRDYTETAEADLVFSLHACDNATDYAIAKALSLRAKAILLVPCCQHEFYQKAREGKKTPLREYLAPLAADGVLLEKFSSLATDGFRAHALRLCGYHVDVMEFIDMEHTPKNILIRAVRGEIPAEKLRAVRKQYEAYKRFLGISPLLEQLIGNYYLA